MADPLTLLALLGPVAVEAVKGAVSRWIAPSEFKPATVEQWQAMRSSDIALFQAVNAAGSSGTSYPWVEAVIKLQRPFVVICVLAVWAWSRTSGMPSEAIDNAAAIVGFYLFGDRTLFHAKKAIASR